MGQELPRSGRPDKDPRFNDLIHNTTMLSSVLTGVPYAGEGDNPLPMISRNLYDVKRLLAAGGSPLQDALYFAFYNDTYSVPIDKGVAVPQANLWWLAYPADVVLLSDGATHHYTRIARVDRDNERIYFVDPWPDDFFLLPRMNRFGIRSGRDPSPNISASEFLRVVVGIITCDTTVLIMHYVNQFPAAGKNAETIVRFGYALLDTEAHRFIADAARLFADAVVKGPGPFYEIAVVQVFMSTMCGFYFAKSRNDQREASELMSMMSNTIGSRNLLEIEAALTADDLLRLGHAAGIAKNLVQAERYFTASIARDPAGERAYFYRGIARVQSGNHAAAASDAEQSLILNRSLIDRLEQTRTERASYGRWVLKCHEGEIAGAYARRSEEQNLLEQAKAGLVGVEPQHLSVS